jgi:hypothetical protein
MIKGEFKLKQIRGGGTIHEIVKRNTIDSSSGGLMYKIINHMVSSSGNAGIYLDQNFTDSDVGGTSAGTSQNGKNGIFCTSPSATASYTLNNEQTQSNDALFHNSLSESQPQSNKAQWKARRTWGAGSESAVTGTSYVTDFYLGKDYSVGDPDGLFQIPFASVTLTGSNRIQPAINDIIDITWTITVG